MVLQNNWKIGQISSSLVVGYKRKDFWLDISAKDTFNQNVVVYKRKGKTWSRIMVGYKRKGESRNFKNTVVGYRRKKEISRIVVG